MDSRYTDYLALLDDLCLHLERLTALSRQKADAVRRDDLMSLDEVLKQEQAISLALRGQEQKRLALLEQLKLTGIPLSGLAEHYPEALRSRARQTADNLKAGYDIYTAAAQVARNTLECNLHEIEKIIAAKGIDPVAGPGYTPPGAEPPKNMKTDFRA